MKPKGFRKRHNMTQLKLADISGFSLDAVKSFETGRRTKNLCVLENFCDLFNKHEELKKQFNDKLDDFAEKLRESSNEFSKEAQEIIYNYNKKTGIIFYDQSLSCTLSSEEEKFRSEF
jgi:transcriptional regulator with XRE-family HTH domain